MSECETARGCYTFSSRGFLRELPPNSSEIVMPIYEYECRKCGHRFERIQKFSDRKVRTCPECKGRVDRLLHAPAIQFKGSGWYVTDYSDKGKASSKQAKEESEAPKSESKTSAKKDNKDKKSSSD